MLDLGVAVLGDKQGQHLALARGQRGEAGERAARLDGRFQRVPGFDERVGVVETDVVETDRAALFARQRVRLMDGDGAQRAEQGVAAVGWRRNRIAQAFAQASSISSSGARTAPRTARSNGRVVTREQLALIATQPR